jgi:hypothetical protein
MESTNSGMTHGAVVEGTIDVAEGIVAAGIEPGVMRNLVMHVYVY